MPLYPIFNASDSTMSDVWGCGMVIHGKCLTHYLFCLTNVVSVWDSFYADTFFLSLLHKGWQIIFKSLK